MDGKEPELRKKPGPAGTALDPELIMPIAAAFGKVFSVRRAAGLMMLSHYKLKKWLQAGEQDVNADIVSNEAKLYFMVAFKLSEKAAEYIGQLEKRCDNPGPLQWLLERCLGKDYGANADEHMELAQLYENLLTNYQHLTNKVGLLFNEKISGEKES